MKRAAARANRQAEDAQHSHPGATHGATASTGLVENESADGPAVDEDAEEAERVDGDEPGEPAARD